MVKIILFLVLLVSLLNFPYPLRAQSFPNITSPKNGETVSSVTLRWDIYEGAIQYRVMVDDEDSFLKPYKKDYYTSNNYYSPKLDPGTYFWRVSAKGTDGKWGSFSNLWSFTLGETASPTSAPAPNSTSAQSTNQPNSNQFTISDIPTDINSDQSFSAAISLTLPNSSNTSFYLKGAFKTSDGTNYFGQSKVGSSWIKNGSSYSSQYKITTDSFGNWGGLLEIKPDPEDSGFIGTGDYIFKVGRYSSSGSGPTWSNEVSIKINKVEDLTASQGEEQVSLDSSPLALGASIVSPNTKSKSSSPGAEEEIASESTAAAKNENNPDSLADLKIKGNVQINPVVVTGFMFILAGCGYFAYLYLKGRRL